MKNILSVLFLSISLFSIGQNIQTDLSFNPGLGFNSANPEIISRVYSTAIQPNGQIVVGGNFTSFNGASMNFISRLNSDGSLDATFNTGIGFDTTVLCVYVQNDGKILVGGAFRTYNGINTSNIIRLNSDGSIDNSFVAGIGNDGFVRTISMQVDGKILVGGSFSINGTQVSKISRLNTDGSIDNLFSAVSFTGIPLGIAGFFADPIVNSIVTQPDGKIIIGGSFSKINSTSRNSIARLNTNGSLDVSFNSSIGFDFQTSLYTAVNSINLQSDSKIIATGLFDQYNGTIIRSIARINTDGTLDLTFSSGSGFGSNEYGNTLAIQPDGKILVGGGFTTYNGVQSKKIVRLNSNGTIDASFNSGNGFNGQPCEISSINLQPDERIIAAGKFTSFDGTNRTNIARLIECSASTNSASSFTISSCTPYTTSFGQVLTASGTYTGVITNHLGCDSTITINFNWNHPTSDYQNICIVGVNQTTGKNKIIWEKEQTPFISNYNVYRENTQSGSFDLIGTTNYADSSVFEDLNANPIQQAYTYQIKYVDTCGNESNAGSQHTTLHLTINQGVGTTWNLIWTPYSGFNYPSYNIYRGTNASNMTLLTTVASNITSYTDANAPSGFVYYQIEIVSPSNCNPTKSSYNNSRSNISTNDPIYLGVSENILNPITIYPNPANNIIDISYAGQIQKVEIMDTKGAKVYSSIENKKDISLPSRIETGYYLVLIHTQDGVYRKELVVYR